MHLNHDTDMQLRRWLKRNQPELARYAYERHLDNPEGGLLAVHDTGLPVLKGSKTFQIGGRSCGWYPVDSELVSSFADIEEYMSQYDPLEHVAVTLLRLPGQIGFHLFADMWPSPRQHAAERGLRLMPCSTEQEIRTCLQEHLPLLTFLARSWHERDKERGIVVLNLGKAASDIMDHPDLIIPRHALHRINATACVSWNARANFTAHPSPHGKANDALLRWLDSYDPTTGMILVTDNQDTTILQLMSFPNSTQDG